MIVLAFNFMCCYFSSLNKLFSASLKLLLLVLLDVVMATNNVSNMQLVSKTRTLTRSASASSMLSRVDVPGASVCQKDYALDKTRSLEKKNLSCQKEHMKTILKAENNLVIEFSTAAYELAKKCLSEQFNDSTFPHSVEKRESRDGQGAAVDTCYKVFNKKADGTCGKKLKFTINLYHTTSQILVNGSKVEAFMSDIYDKLCALMRTRCRELDILNTNISTAINEATKTQTLSAKTLATNVNEPETQSNQCNGELSEDEEVCEICPLCREQAYGTTVQCGECGDWYEYHFECIKADENTFRALADDDFICRSCSDGLLYDNNKQDSTVNEDCQLSQTNNELLSLVDVELNSERSVSQTDIHNISIEHSVNYMPTQIPKEKTSAAPVKPKVKKPVKTNKLKKAEVPDKSYILELESQVSMLKSTIDLYKKRNDQLVNQKRNADTQEHVYSGPETNRTEHECKHRCCTELAEKIQDNRIRLLETQMMQNMYINNAMHIQLVSQMRSSYPVPVMQCDPRVYGYNGIHCHPPNAWTHTPYSNVPYGHYQPSGMSPSMPLIRPPAYMHPQTRPPTHVIPGTTPVYGNQCGPVNYTQQGSSGVVHPGQVGTNQPGFSTVTLPVVLQPSGALTSHWYQPITNTPTHSQCLHRVHRPIHSRRPVLHNRR